MKTTDISTHGAERDLTFNKPQKVAPEGTGFQELLKDELMSADKTSLTEKTTQDFGPQALFKIPPHILMALETKSSAPEPSLEEVTKVLDAWEKLEQAMGTVSTSPKVIQQQLEGIQNELSNIQGTLAPLPTDHPLKTMNEEMRILAYVESIKWNRGDYL